jgi:hypothetical protein
MQPFAAPFIQSLLMLSRPRFAPIVYRPVEDKLIPEELSKLKLHLL